VIEPDLTSQEVKLADPEKVEYVKQNKSEYISHTKRVFASNKQIRVFFDDIDISISPKNDNIYGVQLLQTWRGDYYADKGYLFLMIDFTDDEHPKIYVRTWQPEKDEDLFDLGSFVF
ncbi:MAG TPA: nuclear transport factor 2 family protein, partial [Candidatus Cloacimonadota bacterium]|nr:nuclear transport factor 2 family protein [Candidatus Cloacimonadota bacterium]